MPFLISDIRLSGSDISGSVSINSISALFSIAPFSVFVNIFNSILPIIFMVFISLKKQGKNGKKSLYGYIPQKTHREKTWKKVLIYGKKVTF